ncbi:MAG: hypothetical protein JO317_02535 [Verrucomicrobiae bacterium]|nr:hypothetical protein [Verrucomicrobiae bacterium]
MRVTLAKDARVCVTSAAVAVGKRVGRMRRCVLPDFGEWTEDGALRLIGRASSVANIGGRKVHPAEVEHAIRGLNGVREAWVKVCAGSGRDLGRDFLAVAVESERDAGELERDLVARLADWKCPRRWVVRISLPRNSRGKLDRVALEELLA